MNYIGSKYSLLPFLEKNILQFSAPNHDWTFFDIFAGTGIVGKHFKKLGFRVVSNDIQYYSYCLNRAHVGVNTEPRFSEVMKRLPTVFGRRPCDAVLDYLNNLTGTDGFVYRNYCLGGTLGTTFPRQYFTDENGRLCDAVRSEIEAWYGDGLISDDEYFYLLASLIEAVDKVANTASVYGAFLKSVKPSARRRLKLESVEVVSDRKPHQVYNSDGLEIVGGIACDILYIDPPYNQRQYCTNYHVLETIARYDNPTLYGVTGLRSYADQKSPFCYKAEALKALDNLLRCAQAGHIFLSYNSEGMMSEDEVVSVMGKYGKVELVKEAYRRFRADTDRENRRYKTDQVIEYLFCLRKRG